MSASREKKQRQGAGPSEKALQAQKQQAARKRQTVIYTVIGVVVAVLVAALLVWRTGFFQARATAATVGGEKISAAELSYYYYSAYNSYISNYYYYYYYYGLSFPSESDVYDSATGRTYRDYFLETALTYAQENMALADEARKNGHTEAEVKDSLDAQISSLKASAASSGYSYSAYLKNMYGSYMSAGVFEKLYTQDLLADLAYSEKANAVLDSYTEADLRAYYEADDHADTLDTFEYSYLYFTPAEDEEDGDASDDNADAGVPDEDAAEVPDEADDETPDEADGDASDEDDGDAQQQAALALAKANAEAALEALRDGGSVSDLAEEYGLDDADYRDRETGVGVTSAPSVIRDTLLSMKAGDVELVENGESGYYVVILHSRKLVEDPTKDVRHILAMAETTTDDEGYTVAPTDEAWAAALERIEAIKAEYEAGDKTEDSFAALANEYSDDGDGTTGGLYTDIGPDDNYVSEFLEWIYTDGRKAGDTGIVRHDPGDVTSGYWGYHFMYMVGDGDNEPVWMRTVRNSLTTEAMSDWMEELRGNYPAALAGGASNVGG